MALVAISSFVVTSLLACPAPVVAQLGDSLERSGGGKWILANAVGYGGLGFGLGVLASRAVEGSGGGPVQPPTSAHLLRGSPSSNYGIGGLDLVSAPDGTTIAIVGTATVAGAVAGTLVGLRAYRITAAGGRVEGIHRAAVFGGAVLAGGTLGALAAIPLVDGEGESTPLGSDEQTVALLAGSGAVLGTLFVLKYRHELGSRSISVTPAPAGRRGAVQVRVTW